MIKAELYKQCVKFVDARIRLAEDGLKQAQHAANNETKSSAGDKYETGRAMMHLEKEKLASQLSEALKMKKALDQVDIQKSFDQAELGALIQTEAANYFISVSAGIIEFDGLKYFAISPASPIGQQLLGKARGEEFTFAGKDQVIKAIS